jgi:hypothetical protein
MGRLEHLPHDEYQAIFGFLGLDELLVARRVSRRLAARLTPTASPGVWGALRPAHLTSAMTPWLTSATVAELTMIDAAFGFVAACQRSPATARLLADALTAAREAACRRGHLSKLQWLVAAFGVPDISDSGLRHACLNGHAHVVEWLLPQWPAPAPLAALHAAFGAACRAGALELARRLLGPRDLDATAVVASVMVDACDAGHLAVVEWLVARFSLTARHMQAVDHAALRGACRRGHRPLVQWLVERFDVTFKRLFTIACESGDLPLVQWLAGRLGVTRADLVDHACLSNACAHGHLPVAKWIVCHFALAAPPDQLKEDLLFVACKNGQLAAARWLMGWFSSAPLRLMGWFSPAPLRIPDASSILQETLAHGHLATAQWLVATFKLTKEHVDAGEGFVSACATGRLVVARWLLASYPNGGARLRDALVAACRNGHLSVVRWLLCECPEGPPPPDTNARIVMEGRDEDARRLAATWADAAEWLAATWAGAAGAVTASAVMAGAVTADAATAGAVAASAVMASAVMAGAATAGAVMAGAATAGAVTAGAVTAGGHSIPTGAYACLYVACTEGHVAVAEWLATHYSLPAELPPDVKRRLWNLVCSHGHLAAAQWLVRRFRIVVADVQGCRPAVRAARNAGKLEFVHWLVVDFGLDFEAEARESGRTPAWRGRTAHTDRVDQWLALHIAERADSA